MNRKEEALRALRFDEVRPTPYTVWFDAPTRERLTDFFGTPDWEKRLGNYLWRISLVWEPKEYVAPGRYRDLHGTVWQEGNPLHMVEPGLKSPDLQGYEIPSYLPYVRDVQAGAFDPSHGIVPGFDFQSARHALEREGREQLSVVMYGQGILERAWMIRGLEGFFTDLILEPVFVEEFLDLILERQLELLEAVLQLPCDAVLTADDYGDQRGVMIGPALWRRWIKPRLRLLWDRIHRAGKLVFHHSCGNVLEIVPDLIDIGLDCLQSVQPEAMPVYELKRRYGDRLSLWGGLGTQQLLPFGTPDQIRAEARRLKLELGRGGGYVFTSAKPIMAEVPLENALALIEESMGPEAFVAAFGLPAGSLRRAAGKETPS